MHPTINPQKILSRSKLQSIKQNLGKNKVLGLCHGVFDVLHHGHLKHFMSAKEQCDFLVVSITCDKFVNKNINGPFHTELKRLEMLAALGPIDAVYINEEPTSDDVLRTLKPHKYFKGVDYVTQIETNPDLIAEKNTCEEFGGELVFTTTEKESSTHLINNYLDPNRQLISKFIRENEIDLDKEAIETVFRKLGSLTVDLFGETIEDIYCFGKLTGVSTKFTAPSFLASHQNAMLGGVAALVPLLATLGCQTNIIMPHKYSGRIFKEFESVSVEHRKIVEATKTRFISERRKERLFEHVSITEGEKIENTKVLEKLYASGADCTIAYDFGHGYFENVNYEKIGEIPYFSVNVQSNSTNYPFNDCSKYTTYKILTVDERELRLTLRDNQSSVKKLIEKFLLRLDKSKGRCQFFTFGEKGAAAHKDGELVFCPAAVNSAIDATGSGDVFHLVASLMAKCEYSLAEILLYANVFAGSYAQIEGHSGTMNLQSIKTSLHSLR